MIGSELLNEANEETRMELAVRAASREQNPLWNENKMKLGIFGANVSNGCAMTMAEGRLETTWPNTKMICTTADRAGFEALVPVARWKGFGGTTNFTEAASRPTPGQLPSPRSPSKSA